VSFDEARQSIKVKEKLDDFVGTSYRFAMTIFLTKTAACD